MVNQRELHLLRVNVRAIVTFKGFSGMDSTSNRSIFLEFGLHLIGSFNRVVLADVVVVGLLNGGAPVKSRLTLGWRRPSAVAANVKVGAHVALEVVSGVLLARRVRNAVLVGKLIHTARISTVTGTTSLAIHDNLSI